MFKEVGMIWFTADQHFGHENIIKFTNRPFSSVEEMDQTLIDRWNEVVAPDDTVWHLGDFTLGDADKARYYFQRLNGTKFVLGNYWHHDKRWLKGVEDSYTRKFQYAPYVYLYVQSPLYVMSFPELGNKYPRKITLCHYPMISWEASYHGEWHLFGHCHGKYQHPGKAFDVGVDCNEFTPVSLDEVVRRLS
jgi:calcineurin-like phosphoesterase family protein